eukprot:9987811-Alexandrium_andersonii.AAC.1
MGQHDIDYILATGTLTAWTMVRSLNARCLPNGPSHQPTNVHRGKGPTGTPLARRCCQRDTLNPNADGHLPRATDS